MRFPKWFKRLALDVNKFEIEAYCLVLKKETTIQCADMIESASRPVPYTGEFGEGYRLAQKELADMLRKVADGEITAALCRKAWRVPTVEDFLGDQNAG